jgi:hypothetical protein
MDGLSVCRSSRGAIATCEFCRHRGRSSRHGPGHIAAPHFDQPHSAPAASAALIAAARRFGTRALYVRAGSARLPIELPGVLLSRNALATQRARFESVTICFRLRCRYRSVGSAVFPIVPDALQKRSVTSSRRRIQAAWALFSQQRQGFRVFNKQQSCVRTRYPIAACVWL